MFLCALHVLSRRGNTEYCFSYSVSSKKVLEVMAMFVTGQIQIHICSDYLMCPQYHVN